MQIEASVVIDRPVDAVFRFTAADHVANHPRWDPAVRRIEPLDAGPLGRGSRFRIDRRTAGREEARVFEVTEWEAPHRFTIETHDPNFRLRLIEALRPEGTDRTLMTLVGEAEIGGLRGLLAPLIRGRQQEGLQANLERIKAMVEAS